MMKKKIITLAMFAFMLFILSVGLFVRTQTTQHICVSSNANVKLNDIKLSTARGITIRSFKLGVSESKLIPFRSESDDSLTLKITVVETTFFLENQGYVTNNGASKHTFVISPDFEITYFDGIDRCK